MKYTPADVALFKPLELCNKTLILYKDDFEIVSQFPCLLGHPVLTAKQAIFSTSAECETN